MPSPVNPVSISSRSFHSLGRGIGYKMVLVSAAFLGHSLAEAILHVVVDLECPVQRSGTEPTKNMSDATATQGSRNLDLCEMGEAIEKKMESRTKEQNTIWFRQVGGRVN